MTTVAHELARTGRPARPGWKDALTASFLGWLIAYFVLGAAAALAFELGLVGRTSWPGLGGDGLRDWPYPNTGVFSLAANAVVWLAALASTALLVRGFFGRVSAFPVALILALTGFAPLIPRGVLELPWLVQLLLTAALLRLAAGTVAPLLRRHTAALFAAGSLLLAVPAAYGFMHPLWLSSMVQSSFESARSGGIAPITFGIANRSFADVEVAAVWLRTSMPLPISVSDVRADRQPPTPPGTPFPPSPQPPFTIDARSEAFVQLRVRAFGCFAPAEATALVRYRLSGESHTAAVPIALPERRCA